MSEAGVPIWKVQLVRESAVKAARRPVASAEDAAAVVAAYLKGADREHCVVVLLDARHKVIGLNTVSIGTVSASLVHPREVFKPAILANASAIILAHNHPSGKLEPSEHDVELTRRLIEAGKLLGIELMDHLILCEGAHLSLRASGKVLWGRTR
jgi:DNA repair protein RadC